MHTTWKLSLAGLLLIFAGSATQAQGIGDTVKLGPVEVIDRALKRIPYQKQVVLKSILDDEAVRDIGEVLRSVPNVSGLRKGGANIDPVVRGFKFSQLLTLINGAVGIEGGCPNRMDPTTSHVDIDDIEQMEVIKGPFALRYGPAFGGVVNLITLQPQPYAKFEVHGRASVGYESNWNGNKQHVDLRGGNRFVYFLMSANRMQYGNYDDGNGTQYSSSFEKTSYSAKLGFTPAKKHQVLLSYMGAQHSNVRFPALQMDERSDLTNSLSLAYVTKGHNGVFSGANLKASYTVVNHVMDNKSRANSDTAVAVSDVTAATLGVRGGVDLNFKDKYILFLGGDFMLIAKDGDRVKTMIMQAPMNGMIPTKTEALWNDASMYNLGLYGEFKTMLGTTWDVVGTLRLDQNHATSGPIVLYGTGTPPPVLLYNDTTTSNFLNLSFSGGVTKRWGDHYALSFSLGRGTRSPNMLERFIILLPVGYDNYEYLGNPQLKPETNNEADLGFKYYHEKAGTAEVNVFYSIVEGFISGRRLPPSVQKPLTANVLGVKEFYNAGTAYFTGFELAYRTPESWKPGGRISAAYTYATISSVTKQLLDPTKIVSQQVIGEEVLTNDALSEIPPLEINVSAYYKFFNGKLVPRVACRMVLDQGHVSEAFYEKTTPGFVLLNLGLTYKYKSFLTLSGGVNNLLNTAYYEHLNRKMIGSTGRLYEPGRVLYANVMFNF